LPLLNQPVEAAGIERNIKKAGEILCGRKLMFHIDLNPANFSPELLRMGLASNSIKYTVS
jgi:hypothetical protein